MTAKSQLALILGATAMIAANGAAPFEVESGAISFQATTNMPGVEVKGTSNSATGSATLEYEGGAVIVDEARITVAAKSLSTAMKLRDEHMR